MRGLTPCCIATIRARNAACRRYAQPPRPVKIAAKTTSMPQRNLKSNVMTAAVRRPRLTEIADGLAAAVAVSLPWLTSATSILIVLWIIAVVPTLDIVSVRRELVSAAGGLPVLLWALGVVGMLWADVSWSERIAGLSEIYKLLSFHCCSQFRRSQHAELGDPGLSRFILGVAGRLVGLGAHARGCHGGAGSWACR